MHFGWISIEKRRRQELLDLGITIGKWDLSRFLNCCVPDEVLDALDSLPQCFTLLDYYEDAEGQVN